MLIRTLCFTRTHDNSWQEPFRQCGYNKLIHRHIRLHQNSLFGFVEPEHMAQWTNVNHFVSLMGRLPCRQRRAMIYAKWRLGSIETRDFRCQISYRGLVLLHDTQLAMTVMFSDEMWLIKTCRRPVVGVSSKR
jgi:hypothetical protein